MEIKDWQKERNSACKERYELSGGRLETILGEETVSGKYADYFRTVSSFLMQTEEVLESILDGSWEKKPLEEMRRINTGLYADILEDHYEDSYADPACACRKLGKYGQFLSALYAELRTAIPYAYEGRKDYLTILKELFIEVYNCFEAEKEPSLRELKRILYWYASDYSDVYLEDRILEQIDPDRSFAADIIRKSDLSDERFLYRYGEYVTEQETGTLRHLLSLPQEMLQRIADVYTEGYRIGFINTGKDLSIKSTVNIRYCLGFEPVIRLAVCNFEKMGLKPTIYRAASGIVAGKGQAKIGYFGASANKQYEYDHRQDAALVLDKRLVERKLAVMKNVYEKNRDLAAGFAGPACMEVFGERPFSPEAKPEAAAFGKRQNNLSLLYESKSGELVNQYIKGEERSYTIVAYPVPAIGEQYPEIFREIVRINTLDASLYEKIQQTLIDALDQGTAVHILGRGENRTDLTVQLRDLKDPEKETLFENCVADVNIPAGEVFTSPKLAGTNGVLAVGKVYLNGLQYRDLQITFRDGMIRDYTCSNFEKEEENRDYIRSNILRDHETLPLGEFAVGTNTTAYAAAKKYAIEEKLPILIAEKMGPHFAVGDTCYSWSEDVRVYNPNGKEIVAKENEISALRTEDPRKAYFHCHTDITIPYEEIGEISVVTKEGNHIILLKDGKFALAGTEVLNGPLEEAGR